MTRFGGGMVFYQSSVAQAFDTVGLQTYSGVPTPMLTASPITRQTVGKTFSIAISTLGVGAAFQLAIIGWAFATRPANPLPSFSVTEPATGAHLVATAPANALPQPDFTNPFPEPPEHITTSSTGVAPTKPTPVPQRTPAPEPINAFEETMLKARLLRERGDMAQAITKFREACTMDPKNAMPIAELAATYEKMGNEDRAAEQWRKIIDIGESAGIYYQLGLSKLQNAQSADLRKATKPADTGAVDKSVAIEGIAAGATLGILPIHVQDEAEDGAAKRFTLHIPIKARPKTHMEVRDLVIHVLFYDIVDGQNVVQTSANVNTRWMAPPADWTEGDVEELAVEYQLPKTEAKGAKRENRKYFGYIVRIYYKQQLQAAAAEPERLAQQYPPPPTLPKDPDK